MSMRHQIDPDRRLVIAWYEDQLDPEDYKTFVREVAASPDFRPDFRLLAIFSGDLDLSELSVEAMRELQAAEAMHLKRPKGSVGIIIAQGEMAEVISMVYKEFAAANPNLATDIHLVSTVAEAEALLGEPLTSYPMPAFAKK